MSVLKFHANKLLSFEYIEIFIFLRLGRDYLTTPLLKGFWEILPKRTQNRHMLAWFRVFELLCVKIGRRVTSVGESLEQKNKKERPYISRIWPDAPSRPICTKFGLRVWLMDVIKCAKFYRNRLRGLILRGGRILTIPIGLRCRR